MSQRLVDLLEALQDSYPKDEDYDPGMELAKRQAAVDKAVDGVEVNDDTAVDLAVVSWELSLALRAALDAGGVTNETLFNDVGRNLIRDTLICALADPLLREGVKLRAVPEVGAPA